MQEPFIYHIKSSGFVHIKLLLFILFFLYFIIINKRSAVTQETIKQDQWKNTHHSIQDKKYENNTKHYNYSRKATTGQAYHMMCHLNIWIGVLLMRVKTEDRFRHRIHQRLFSLSLKAETLMIWIK